MTDDVNKNLIKQEILINDLDKIDTNSTNPDNVSNASIHKSEENRAEKFPTPVPSQAVSTNAKLKISAIKIHENKNLNKSARKSSRPTSNQYSPNHNVSKNWASSQLYGRIFRRAEDGGQTMKQNPKEFSSTFDISNLDKCIMLKTASNFFYRGFLCAVDSMKLSISLRDVFFTEQPLVGRSCADVFSDIEAKHLRFSASIIDRVDFHSSNIIEILIVPNPSTRRNDAAFSRRKASSTMSTDSQFDVNKPPPALPRSSNPNFSNARQDSAVANFGRNIAFRRYQNYPDCRNDAAPKFSNQFFYNQNNYEYCGCYNYTNRRNYSGGSQSGEIFQRANNFKRNDYQEYNRGQNYSRQTNDTSFSTKAPKFQANYDFEKMNLELQEILKEQFKMPVKSTQEENYLSDSNTGDNPVNKRKVGPAFAQKDGFFDIFSSTNRFAEETKENRSSSKDRIPFNNRNTFRNQARRNEETFGNLANTNQEVNNQYRQFYGCRQRNFHRQFVPHKTQINNYA